MIQPILLILRLRNVGGINFGPGIKYFSISKRCEVAADSTGYFWIETRIDKKVDKGARS